MIAPFPLHPKGATQSPRTLQHIFGEKPNSDAGRGPGILSSPLALSLACPLLEANGDLGLLTISGLSANGQQMQDLPNKQNVALPIEGGAR